MSAGKKHRSDQEGEEDLPAKRVKSVADTSRHQIAVQEQPERVKEKAKKKKKGEKRSKAEKKANKEKRLGKRAADSNDQQTDHIAELAETRVSGSCLSPCIQSKVSKRIYEPSVSLSALSESEVQEFLLRHQITTSDQSTLRPILKFSDLPLSALTAQSPFAKFSAPTPIQSVSWPFALSGRDVVGVAETGSGKTLAFALPCIEALHTRSKPGRGGASRHGHAKAAMAMAVIISPTRELAMQTHAAIQPLGALVGISSVCLFGGASKDDQRALLKKKEGADVVVATPGRLKDFLAEGAVSLASAQFVVLDEADRMLDKGFEDDIKLILGACPDTNRRQTLMFTATWPTSVRGLADSFMTNPVRIAVGGKTKVTDSESAGGGYGDVELQANARIIQTVEVIGSQDKDWRLLRLLKETQKGQGMDDRILVFCLYKKEAVRVESFLLRKGIRVASIHGDLKQEQRTRSLEAFKAGSTTVLVATDVAARGLDIPEVKLVINVTVSSGGEVLHRAIEKYKCDLKRILTVVRQFPLTIEDYVHRIGRTGRAGKSGHAVTFFTEHDKAHSGSLINVLKAANQVVPEELLKFGTTVKKRGHDTYGAFFKNVDMSKKGTKITFD